MSSKWSFLKAFDNRPSESDPNANANWLQWITGTNLRTKRALDVAVQNFNADAFGRFRVSNLQTLFDSKQIKDALPLFWDDQEVSGGGTSSTHSTAQASSTLSVSATTAGKRVRQTFQRFNYEPGKSQLIVLTGVLGSQPTDVEASMGFFDDNNGIFLKNTAGITSIVKRTSISGSVVDVPALQTAWNLDVMDGSGDQETNPSGIQLDFDKTQIFFIDFEWLGVGRVRCGFFVDGVPIYVHEFNHANTLATVYMSTPNLPLRYEIAAGGTNPTAASIVHICSSVATEGGTQSNGVLRHKDSGTLTTLAAGTVYAVLGIRLKTTHLDIVTKIENISALATSQNDKAHWELRFNPTVAGTFTYNDETNSAVQIATGANTNTVTGGTEIDGGYFTDTAPVVTTVPNALRLGSAIDGTRDTIVLCCRPITNNISIEGSMTWRELL